MKKTHTAADRLRWFLEFAQRPWNAELKDWEFLKLKEEIIEFIGGSAINEPVRFRAKNPNPTGYHNDNEPIYKTSSAHEVIAAWATTDEVKRLAVSANWYLRRFLASTQTIQRGTLTPDGEFIAHGNPEIVPKKRDDTIRFGTPSVSFHMPTATWLIETKPSHLFFIRFGLVLMEEGTSHIETCPECNRLFYRVRKQKFCSKTCINRVSRRNWLEKPRNKRKERQWARERYQRRVQEKTSKKARVKSRNKRNKSGHN
jgi:hypothetical protein